MKKLFAAIALISALMVFVTGTAFAQTKPTIVLLHGAFQTEQGWGFVKGRLEAHGYSVVAIRLPGRGDDATPIDQITMDLYRTKVLEAIDALPGPVVLVGHSFGGMVISTVAEAEPEKIKSLVYLSAYLPKSGQSLDTLAHTDPDSILSKPGNFIVSDDHKYASIKDDAKADTFANDADEAGKKLIVASIIKEPLAPLGTPVTLTDEKFGKVKKFYIFTTEDQAVSPSLQARMLEATPVYKVIKIKAGHASFVTDPDDVTAAIIEAAQ
jgi:pimeloyl-ACP methyl ester carboxylesterase